MDNGTPTDSEYQETIQMLLTGLVMIMRKLGELGDTPTPEEAAHFRKCLAACDAIGVRPMTMQ